MTSNEKQLISILLSKSSSGNWEVAKLQWEISGIHIGEDTCSCGKTPIKFICQMRNTVTGNTAILGSTCVEKYLSIKCTMVFKDMLVNPVGRFVKLDTLDFAHRLKYVNDWEYNCYLDLQKWAKRKPLTIKQEAVRDKVNNNIARLLESIT